MKDQKKKILDDLGVEYEEVDLEDTQDQGQASVDTPNENRLKSNVNGAVEDGLSSDNQENRTNQLSGGGVAGDNSRNHFANTKPLRIKDSLLTKSFNAQTKILIGRLMRKSPFESLSEKELKTLMDSRLKGNPFKKMLDKNPKMEKSFISFLRDKKAIPSLVRVINQPDKLKYMGIAGLVILVCGFIFNLKNSRGSLIKRIFTKILITVSMSVATLISFFIIFKDNIDPTIKILTQNLF